MFDRGLISLKDDLEILISRHVNDAEGVKSIFNRSGRALAPSSASGRIRISSLGTASTASSTDQHEGLCFHKMADVAKGQGAPASAERDRHADREPGECCHHEIDVSDHETRAAHWTWFRELLARRKMLTIQVPTVDSGGPEI
jgi:hypothetical protein